MAYANTVLEFGTSKIACLTLARGKGMDLPNASCVRYSGIQHGSWVEPAGLRPAIEQLIDLSEKKTGRQITNATVGIPGAFCFFCLGESTCTPQTGRVGREDIERMVQRALPGNDSDWTLSEITPAYFLDQAGELYANAPIGRHIARLTGVFSYLYVKKSFLSDVEDALNALRIHPTAFVSEAHAQAMYCIPAQKRDAGAILMDVGYYDTNLSVVFADAILAHRCIHMGGASLTDDLQMQLGLDPVVAESIKRSYIFGIYSEKGARIFGKDAAGRMQSCDHAAVRHVIESTSALLCDRVNAVLRDFSEYISRTTPVYLTGAGLAMRGADAFVRARTGRRTTDVLLLQRDALSPVYHTSLALLDNHIPSVYHLNSVDMQNSLLDKMKRFFR